MNRKNNNKKTIVIKEPKIRRIPRMVPNSSLGNNVVNQMVINKNGRQPEQQAGIMLKFIDAAYSINPTATGVISATPINAPLQGVGVSQRTGDTIYMKKLYINYAIDAANSDIYSTARVMIFQWHVNTQLATPAVADILQSANIYSMYNWQYSNQVKVLYDRVHFFSGLATAPTSASNQGYYGSIKLDCIKKVQFDSGLSLGSQSLWVMTISDSALAPFPLLNIYTRVVYSED